MALSDISPLSLYQSSPANWAPQFGGRYVDTSDSTPGWVMPNGGGDGDGYNIDPVAVGYDGRRVYAGPEAAYLQALAKEGYAPVSDLNQFQAQLPYAQQTNAQMFPDFQSYLQYMYGPGASIVNDPVHGQLVKAANSNLALNPNHVGFNNGAGDDFIGTWGPLAAGFGLLGAAGAFGGAAAGGGGAASYSPAGAFSGGDYGLASAGTGIGGVGTAGQGFAAGGGLGLGQTAATGAGLTGGLAGGNALATGLTGSGMDWLSGLFGSSSGLPTGLLSLSNLASGILGSNAAKNAASTQAAASDRAIAAQLGMFDTINNQQAPYRAAGYSALGDISGMKDFLNHQFNAQDLKTNLAPNYQFQLDQGLGALKNKMNVDGGIYAGNTLRGINDYAQNYAGNAYQQAFNNFSTNQTNIYNRLASIAGLGQAANSTTAQAGTQTAGNVGNALSNLGAAQAAGIVGSNNAITGAMNNAASWYALPSLLNMGR